MQTIPMLIEGIIFMENILKRINTSNDYRKVLIIGDSIIDKYVFCTTRRMAMEASIPIFLPNSCVLELGGAANVLKMAKSLNGNVQICTIVGDDEDGEWLKGEFSLLDSDIGFVFTDSDRRTTKKIRYVNDKSEYQFRVDIEDVSDISKCIEDKVYSHIEAHINRFNMLVISDYAKGMITESFSKRLIELFNKFGKIVLIDPKSNNILKYKDSFLVKSNFKEFKDFLNYDDLDFDYIEDDIIVKYATELMKKANIKNFYITLGNRGGIFISNDYNTYKITAKGKNIVDIIGAGDSVLAALSVSLTERASIRECVEFSSYVAGACVEKFGSVAVTVDEVKKMMSTT